MDGVTDRVMDNRAMGRVRRRHMGPRHILARLPRLLTVMGWVPTPDTRHMHTAIRIRTMEASEYTSARVLDTGEVIMVDSAEASAARSILILLVTRLKPRVPQPRHSFGGAVFFGVESSTGAPPQYLPMA